MGTTSTLPAFARTSGRRIAQKFDPWLGGRGPNPGLDVQGIFADAVRHHMAGRLEDAVAGYKRVLFLKPGYAEVHNNLGVALAAQGRVAEAMSRYEHVLALNPRHAGAHHNLGILLAAQGRMDDAVAHY